MKSAEEIAHLWTTWKTGERDVHFMNAGELAVVNVGPGPDRGPAANPRHDAVLGQKKVVWVLSNSEP